MYAKMTQKRSAYSQFV
jgi:hypothetical protein